MFCYVPGSGFLAVCAGVLLYAFRAPVEAFFHLMWVLGTIGTRCLFITICLAIVSGMVRFVAWTAARIRARQAARGACLTCPHPCQQAQTDGAADGLPAIAETLTALPWPVQALPAPARALPGVVTGKVVPAPVPVPLFTKRKII